MPCEVDNPYSKVQEKRILYNHEAPVVGDQNHKVIFLFVLVFLHYAVTSFQDCTLIGQYMNLNGYDRSDWWKFENSPDPLYVPISILFELFQNFPYPKNEMFQSMFQEVHGFRNFRSRECDFSRFCHTKIHEKIIENDFLFES